MIICAIDPGNVKSAFVLFDSARFLVKAKGKIPNGELKALVKAKRFDALALEYVQPRGQPMYYQLVDTIFWCGRFVEAFGKDNFTLIDRKDVKMHMCGNTTAKDSNIRTACINRFSGREPIGKGKCPEIGNKACHGPLWGFHSDIWQALAVAITYTEDKKSALNISTLKGLDSFGFMS